MDSKAPRIAVASLIFGLILSLLSIVTSVLDLGLESGFGLEEIIMMVLASALFVTSYLSSRQRPVFEDIRSLSVQEQFEALDEMKTLYKPSTEKDHFGLETVPTQSQNTQFLIASVLEQQPVEDPVSMADAFSALGAGDSGLVAAEMARSNPAPHAQTDQFREVIKSSSSTEEDLALLKVTNVPLPGQTVASDSPDLPWLNKQHDFKTEGSKHVPLPTASGAVPSPPVVPNPLPQIPELTPVSSQPEQKPTPELPSIDDLFD